MLESLELFKHQNQIQWKNVCVCVYVCKVKIKFQTNRKREIVRMGERNLFSA